MPNVQARSITSRCADRPPANCNEYAHVCDIRSVTGRMSSLSILSHQTTESMAEIANRLRRGIEGRVEDIAADSAAALLPLRKESFME